MSQAPECSKFSVVTSVLLPSTSPHQSLPTTSSSMAIPRTELGVMKVPNSVLRTSPTRSMMTTASVTSTTISVPSRVHNKEFNYTDDTELLNMEQLLSVVKDTIPRMDEEENLVS